MKNEKQEVLDLETQDQSLAQLSPFEARVAALVAETKDLTIQGVEDKEGIKQVHEARIELKSTRVEIDHTRKDLIAPALEWQRKVNEKAKELTNDIKPIEDRLKEEEDRIKAEKKRIREEKERARMIKIQERGSFIINNGGQFDGMTYEPGLSYPVELTPDELVEITDDKWEELKDEILQYQKELKAQEARVQATNELDDTLKFWGFQLNEAEDAFVLEHLTGKITLTVEEYQATLQECIDQNWRRTNIPPDKLQVLIDKVDGARKADQEQREKEKEEIRKLQEAQAKKDQELQEERKKRELLEAEAENRKKAEEAAQEFIQEQKTPPSKPEPKAETPQKAAPAEDQKTNQLVRALCEKIVSKPFLSAQLPEAQEILNHMNSHQ